MENRVVALAVLENLIHWPLAHRSGYVAPSSTADEGGEDEHHSPNTVSAGDADDLSREPRQRRIDRCRAVLLLPHLCQKLGSRWVESEVVPYLLRCVEEEDAQLSLVSGLALLGVTLPRRTSLVSTIASPTLDSTTAKAAAASPTNPTPSTATSNAFLSLEDVQPVCALLAASGTEETRAFAAQVVLPHLFFGTGLERDVTLESWDVKYVPISVLHADTLASNSGGADATADSASAAADDGEGGGGGGDAAAATTACLVSAVRQQVMRQRQQEERRLHVRQQQQQQQSAPAGPATTNGASSTNARDAAAASSVPRVRVAPPSADEVRRRCHALAAEDEAMQFLFSSTYESLTGPWGFTGGRLAALCHGAKTLLLTSDAESRSNGASGKRGNGASTHSSSCSGGVSMSVGSGFRAFRAHERRVRGSQVLRGVPPVSLRVLSEADLELYGATYAADATRDGGDVSSSSSSRDDFFTVNVRARALVSDVVRWMEALAPAGEAAEKASGDAHKSPNASSPAAAAALLSPRQVVSFYDYAAHDGRREALRSRWRATLKLLQHLLESPYPGPVAVAVELISGLLHALQVVLLEVEAYGQRQRGQAEAASSRSTSPTTSTTTTMPAVEGEKAGGAVEEESLWGIGVPLSPLLTTAQLQTFIYRSTRRHVAYCVLAAVTSRRVSVPPALLTATDATAWRAPTESLARLLRAALPVAQKALTDLLLRHHLFVKLNAPTAAAGSGQVSCGLVQMGAGPCEARAAALAAWDVSFAPAGGQKAASPMPDDASFLLTPSAGDDGARRRTAGGGEGTACAAVLDRALWLPGILNAFSSFRVHRVIRRSLLRALPLCVDFTAQPCSNTAAAAAAAAPASSTSLSLFSLCAVCPMLLQVLVPPSTLVTQLKVLHAAAVLLGNGDNDKEKTAAAASRQHADPAVNTNAATLEAALPALWATMTAPDGLLSARQTPTAELQRQETPASLDFDLLEAALEAVQRLIAEAAVRITATTALTKQAASSRPSSSSSATAAAAVAAHTLWLHSTCAQLFTLVAACVRWVPRYTCWKARWLVADRLPRLLATFCYFLSSVTDTKVSTMWLQCTLQLLTSVWTCAAAFGVAPLSDLTDDEEVEVRCIAVRCAARTFRRVSEAVLRVSAARPSPSAQQQLLLLPQLSQPLVQLLDATAQCVLVGANDVDPRVRCCSAEALAVLSRTLSLLVAADVKANPLTPVSDSDTSTEAVWTRYLRSNTDALLRLMSDEKPTVQLALVSQLTDLLLMYQRPPAPSSSSGDVVAGGGNSSTSENEGEQQQRNADQVQHEALLNCLRQLAQHELWRLREQYAILLAHLCGRLLQSAMVQPPKPQGRSTGALKDGDVGTNLQTELSPYGHTHPLYQLARTELLTLLVAVLFDKVKAVRDTALDAVERMCLRLAAAARQTHNSLQQDGAALHDTSNGGDSSNGSAVSGGRTYDGAIHSAALPNGRGRSSSITGGVYNANTFVDDVLWPRITAYEKAWETYLSRSALLHIALRLRVDKTSIFIPLLDQLARDPVLNVRLVVAKIILEVLLRSAPEANGSPLPHAAHDGETAGDGGAAVSGQGVLSSASHRPELPSGTVAYRILMNKPDHLVQRRGVSDAVLPTLQFTEEERTGVVLEMLRQLLKDGSSDVRDEAAKALKVCF